MLEDSENSMSGDHHNDDNHSKVLGPAPVLGET